MRKEDITVTTPEHSTIYAIGTVAPSSAKVFGDIEYFANATYKPGYILDILESGFAVALVAHAHPESGWAKGNGQASVLDALDYSLTDYRARMEVMAEYSHWPLSEEQRQEKAEALAELKELPARWEVKVMRTSYVRFLWADYATRLDEAMKLRKVKADAETAEREAGKSDVRRSLQTIVKMKLGVKKKNLEYWLNRASYDSTAMMLPTETVMALVERAKKPERVVSETAVTELAKSFISNVDLDIDAESRLRNVADGLAHTLSNLGFIIEGEQ